MSENKPVHGKEIVARRIKPSMTNVYGGIFGFVALLGCFIIAAGETLVREALGVILGLPGVFFLLFGLRALWAVNVFRSGTMIARAKILEKSVGQYQPHDNRTLITYKIKFESLDHIVILGCKSYVRLPKHKKINIHYAKQNPRVALLEDEFLDAGQIKSLREYPYRHVPKPKFVLFCAGIYILYLGVSGLTNNHEDPLTVFLFTALFVFPGLLITFVGLRSLWHTYLFKTTAVSTVGTLLDRFTSEGGKRGQNYYIIFHFNTQDKSFTLIAKVPSNIYRKHEINKSIQVYYSLSNPRVVLIEGEL